MTKESAMRVAFVVLFAVGLGSAVAGQSQEILTVPVPERPTPVLLQDATPSELAAASKDFVAGRWADFVKKATALVGKITAPVSPDLTRDYVLFLWTETLPTASEPALLSAILHNPIGEPFAKVLPGLQGRQSGRLYEVFVTPNRDSSIASYYVSKPLPDPLLDQVPAVVDRFLGPLFTTLDATVGRDMLGILAVAEPPVALYALVREVQLPESRAGVEAKMVVTMPGSPDEAIGDLQGDFERRGLAITPAQKAALSRAAARMRQAVVDGACVGSSVECRRALHRAATEALAPELRDPALPQRDQLVDLASAIHAAIDAFQPSRAAGSFSMDNSPLTHLGFGLVSAFAPSIRARGERAMLDGNKIAAAGLPQALQMVVLNWSPWGFQQKTTRRWNLRAFARPFAGVVFNPDIGVSGGVSFMVLSNLGVNVGYARLWVPIPDERLQIGADLSEKDATGAFKYSEDLRRDPLRSGRAEALFFGVSYNFK